MDWSKTPLTQRDGCIPSRLRGEGQDGGALNVAKPQQLGIEQGNGFGLRVWEEKGGVQAKIGSG